MNLRISPNTEGDWFVVTADGNTIRKCPSQDAAIAEKEKLSHCAYCGRRIEFGEPCPSCGGWS